MSITSEASFEAAIVASLTKNGGYEEGQAADYDPETGLFTSEVLAFLQSTQPAAWERISSVHGPDTETRLIQRLCQEMDLRSSLDVLRNGFTDYGVRFRMACFQPESGLNPDTIALYEQNRLKVYRQVSYSRKNRNSVDLVLSLNGLPVATLELKNQFTGQNTKNAKRQYASTRDKRELLFAFKKRALVHFAVDTDEVYMTTRIEGRKTFWLPFNKGHNHGKGNPPVQNNYRTAYLWEEILTKDSWLDIIKRFIHLQVDTKELAGRTHKIEKLIFPRYHQLDAVRKITAHAREHGAGQNYLIQHSAGSGKSNSIAWLAYRLASLHNTTDERIFDAVIIVTDRRILDQQLQDTVYQFEHKTGVVQRIDKGSAQLAQALHSCVPLIITTLQKFPFILDAAKDLPDRRYAVIIDEAHSSQGGEASKKMKEVLAASSLGGIEASNEANDSEIKSEMGQEAAWQSAEAGAFYSAEADYDLEDEIREMVEQSCKARGRQQNLSFFAFTATPKYKTLAVFGQKDAAGKPQPFHLYSMRQAIEEGFILDVLANYTTYSLFFKLSKAIEDDPEMNKKKAAQAIARFVSLHPHNLAQKTEVIIEHFRQVVAAQIGGRAKAMLVTGSRLHAKRYYDEFQRYLKAREYKDIKVLVAFSGKVLDDDCPEGVTEPQLTGCSEKELPTVFEQEEYKILICADKFQTGFDQPLLHTMYVDKKLSGVKAVQTLSRLNRTCPGKENTFILDFANDRETIFNSFQPYYEITTVKEEPTPNHLYDLKNTLDAQQLYQQSEIDAFARVYFRPTSNITAQVQKELNAFLDPAVDRFNALATLEEQDAFKKGLRTWTNLYAFLAQIMPLPDPDLEKFFAYTRLLHSKLPRTDIADQLRVTDEVALEYYRLQKMKEGAIALEKNRDGELDGISEAGIKRPKDEEAALSEIIDLLNERFGTEFEQADKLFFDQIATELMEDQTLQNQARVNSLDTFKFPFEELFMNKLIERMEQNQDIFERIVENKENFGSVVMALMMKSVYEQLNETRMP
ncbi:type I restriction endonuclease subunit R [Candidatus Electrothrix sp.]|uniref:type I restriction endonuclease subunit R n=1 Tax=Candidatus Electrothrix sp. TaxID=2170559 RepID=UPI004056EA84